MPLEAVHAVERELRAAGVPSPRVDAEILVADVLGLVRSELYSSGQDVSDFEAGRLRELVERRVAREPLPTYSVSGAFAGSISRLTIGP
jgi:release factor glutamine methyltransferase